MANSPLSGGLVIRSPQQAAEEDAANRAAGLPDVQVPAISAAGSGLAPGSALSFQAWLEPCSRLLKAKRATEATEASAISADGWGRSLSPWPMFV